MVLLNQIINKGFDGGLLVQGLAKHVRNVLMAKDPQTLPLLEVSDQQRERYQAQAKKCPTPFLYKALQLMNQCDINYRQSSNKRLLVELTLIEIAQITQPKSLFKQLIQQSQPKTTAPQVAVAEPAASTPTRATQSTTPTRPTTPTARAPKLKSSISLSWGNMRQKMNGGKTSLPTDTPQDNGDAENNQPFTPEELQIEWLSMCNRMPQHLSGVATRMKNMNPVITEFPALEVVVENQLAMEQMEQIKGSIVNTLKRDLHNQGITLTMRVAEHKKGERILTRREQYELMEKENPSVAKLREIFDLNLA